MKINLKLALILESFIILLLIGVLVHDYAGNKKISITADAVQSRNNFLSNRIYTKELPPESFMIADFTPLKNNVQEYLNNKKKNVSVYVVNLRNGVSMGINEKNKFWPASLNKLPIAVAVMKKIEKGGLRLDTSLQILESDLRCQVPSKNRIVSPSPSVERPHPPRTGFPDHWLRRRHRPHPF